MWKRFGTSEEKQRPISTSTLALETMGSVSLVVAAAVADTADLETTAWVEAATVVAQAMVILRITAHMEAAAPRPSATRMADVDTKSTRLVMMTL